MGWKSIVYHFLSVICRNSENYFIFFNMFHYIYGKDKIIFSGVIV